MTYTYIGQQKLIQHHGRLFANCEAAADAVCQLEWAEKILAAPAVTWDNGKHSHEVAGAILEQSEDILLNHARFVA